MEKHFATYEQSLALKELGFNEPCLYSYYQDGTIGSVLRQNGGSNLVNWNESNTLCSRPLKSQVFEWARKEYGYWSYIKEATKGTCRFYIEKFDEKFFNSDIINSYEESESGCIDKLIKLVKNK